ncbi:MAG: nitroreductase family protein [Campylobacterales bacterium]|nr:nitroreductase family protein [Campylobacterales bacterium]
MDKKSLLEILNFRHACKLFDEDKKISKDDLNFILDAARLSPSSFGMEHWRFIVWNVPNSVDKNLFN